MKIAMVFPIAVLGLVLALGSCSSAPAPTTENSVNIQNFAFSPATLTVSAGTTVTWTNLDSTTHKVVSDSGSELDSPNMDNGNTYVHTFNTAGTYAYHCGIHTYMKGTVIVQ